MISSIMEFPPNLVDGISWGYFGNLHASTEAIAGKSAQIQQPGN